MVVLVATAIFLTVAMDVQETTRDVTKYDYITETTGLFDYDETPQYNEYDLAKNYTGYYIESKKPYWSGIGFYDTAKQANNYRLNLEPTASTQTTEDLSASTSTTAVDHATVSFFGPDGYVAPSQVYQGHPVENNTSDTGNVYLKDLLTEYAISDYSIITFKPVGGDIDQRLIFASTDDFIDNFGGTHVSRYTSSEHMEDYPQWYNGGQLYNTRVAGLSCYIDYSTQLVYLYSNYDLTGTIVRQIELDKAIVIFGGTAISSAYDTFGTSMDMDVLLLPPNEYLNIKAGVSVSSTGA